MSPRILHVPQVDLVAVAGSTNAMMTQDFNSLFILGEVAVLGM